MRNSRSLMCGTAAAASLRSTVTRTSSEPARASAATCLAVASASAVSVLVIDCTTTGAPPPTVTLPTLTATVRCRSAGPENSIIERSPFGDRLPWPGAGNGRDIASPRPVYEDQAQGDEGDRQGERRGQRLVENEVARCHAKKRGQEGKRRQPGSRIAHDQRKPRHISDADHPNDLVSQRAERQRRGHRVDVFAEHQGSDAKQRRRNHELIKHRFLGADAIKRAYLDDERCRRPPRRGADHHDVAKHLVRINGGGRQAESDDDTDEGQQQTEPL